MDIDKKLVKKIATLSRIKIEENEVERFSNELSKIISWVEKLNEVDTKDIIPITNPSDIKIPYRKDEINDGKTHKNWSCSNQSNTDYGNTHWYNNSRFYLL